MRRLKVTSLATFAIASFVTVSALAADICVMCNEPAMTYICRPSAAPEHTTFLQDRRLTQLACIREIAKAYSHGSCKANQNDMLCTGDLVVVDLSQMAREYTNRFPKPLRPESLSGGENASAFEPQQPPKGEPKTVVELTKRTVDSSKKELNKAGQKAGEVVKKTGEAIKKAGKAVENGAEKTWRCLSSFFLNC